jgi:regulatory protein
MPLPKKQKILTEKEAIQKIMAFCSYQERSPAEASKKLYGYGLQKDAVESILEYLISEGFINENRFLESFTGGKYRLKKWGKLKIEQSLKTHNIDNQKIEEKLSELSEEEYQNTLDQLLRKKSGTLKEEDPFKKYQKLYRFGVQKGYESDLVVSILKKIITLPNF